MTKKLLKKAFTLVELIIVIAIVAILAVISFLWLNKWLGNARDASRKGNLANLDKALQIYLTEKTTLPKPDNNTMLYASGIEYVIGYQGYFGETVRDSIGDIDKAPKDGNNFFTYYVNNDLSKYQLMAYMENPVAYNPNTANAENYAQRYIYVRGDKLGILTDSEKNPLQDFGGTGFNVLSGENNYTAYFDNSTNANGTGKQLFTYYYNQTKSLLQNTGFAQYDDNLVFYSNMQDLDGTLLKDLSQYGNNGVCHSGINPLGCGDAGGPQFVQGKIGKAMQFDGVDDSIKINKNLINGDERTIFILNKDYKSGINFRAGSGGDGYGGEQEINLSHGGLYIGSYYSNGNYYMMSNSNQTNAYDPVVGLYKKDSFLKLYCGDKFIVEKLSKKILRERRDYNFLGRVELANSLGLKRFLSGTIDEVRIYNRALSDDEVKVIYTATN